MAYLTDPNGFHVVFPFSNARCISGDRHRCYLNIVSTVHFPRADKK